MSVTHTIAWESSLNIRPLSNWGANLIVLIFPNFAQNYNGPESVEYNPTSNSYFISNSNNGQILELDENNNLPFIVLPIDQNKQKVRKLAQYIFYESLIFYILADLDIIDYDTNSYPSWNDRQEANKNGKKPTKFLKSLLDKLSEKNNTNS